MSERTLDLQRPFGQTFLLALLPLALLLIGAELLMRQPIVQAHLTAPKLNSRHRQFEVQWHRLENLAHAGVPIECIALGNSMLWRGFDPEAVQRGYYQQTGSDLRCFNFGVDALSPASAGALAHILVETYQPQLFIFGTDARDFAVPRQDDDTTVILDMPWVRYRTGHFNLKGWVVESSYLYRYRHHLSDMMRLFFQDAVRQGPDEPAKQFGFDSDDAVGDFVTRPPDPQDDSYHVQYYFRLLSDYAIQPENLAGLEELVALQENDVSIVVVEMPVPSSYFAFFGAPAVDYQVFINSVATTAIVYKVPFWQSTHHDLIPDTGWVDYSHLNSQGAVLFSEWLGEQLGQAVNAGELRGLATARTGIEQ